MSREIKFRSWNGESMQHGGFFIHATGRVDAGILHGEHPISIMQYTGLKDKNGVEAFEGDIVIAAMSDRNGKEIGTYVGHIVFDEYEWSIEMESERFPLASWRLVDSFEVIGNIHQHPELLK